MRERSKRTCYGPNTCMNEEEHENCQQSECGGGMTLIDKSFTE